MHLGDSTRWRSIAEANELEDPLALRPGTLLAIPELSG
jgi:nucleoid-associated protein YgaU